MRRDFILVLAIVAAAAISGFGQKDGSGTTEKIRKEIAALGRSYSAMIQRNDSVAIEKILAADYLVADEEGKVFTKAEDLATYKDKKLRVKIETVEYLDQNVRLISKDVAIDHATIRFIGTSNGKSFDITERCTTPWAKRRGKWLIVADHFSVRPPPR